MESALESPTAHGTPRAPAPVIALDRLRRDYGERAVLREVSVELPADQTLAVLGPNGAGKTTLLRILATLLRPTAGAVSVLGAALPRQAHRVRGRIGYLAHEPLLYRELTVRENLEFNARLHGIEHPGRQIEALLARAGLARRGGEVVRNLSAGMLQRAAICRTLLQEPELLLLDEPRSHLDAGAGDVVDELLGPTSGRARVIVTHEVEAALAAADMVLLLGADGSVVHAGSASAVSPGDVRSVYSGSVR